EQEVQRHADVGDDVDAALAVRLEACVEADPAEREPEQARVDRGVEVRAEEVRQLARVIRAGGLVEPDVEVELADESEAAQAEHERGVDEDVEVALRVEPAVGGERGEAEEVD